MKHTLLTIAVILFGISSFAQSYEWEWEKSIPDAVTYGTTSDASGNVYIAGGFSSATLTLGVDTLINKGSSDVLIVKYDSFGNVLWAKSAGGSSSDGCYGIAVSAAGDVYVTGVFMSAITFNSITLSTQGTYDIFIAKYDANGNFQWAKSAGGSSEDYGKSIAIDASENIYITGYFQSSTIAFGSTNVINQGSNNMFIAKYNSSGSLLWVKNPGGTVTTRAYAICVDSNADIYVAGDYLNSLIFGTDTLANNGSLDLFLLKCDQNGNEIWAKGFGGSNAEYGYGLTTDALRNVYFTGTFYSSSIGIDSLILTNAVPSTGEILVAKCNSNGNILWAKSLFGAGTDDGRSLALDATGNLYIGGVSTSQNIYFGNDTIYGHGGLDGIVVAYNSDNGNEVFGKLIGGIGFDNAFSICSDPNNNVYFTGYFQSSSIDFDGDTLINSSGNNDAYIGKLYNHYTTAVKEEATINQNNAFVYPNPTSGNFNINLLSGLQRVQIQNCIGQIIESTLVTGPTSLTLNIKDSGIYFIQITSDSQPSLSKKLIVNK